MGARKDKGTHTQDKESKCGKRVLGSRGHLGCGGAQAGDGRQEGGVNGSIGSRMNHGILE